MSKLISLPFLIKYPKVWSRAKKWKKWYGEERKDARTLFDWGIGRLSVNTVKLRHSQAAFVRESRGLRTSVFISPPPPPPSFRFLLSFQLSQQTYAETLATQFNRASSHWLIRGRIDDIVQRNSFPPNVFRQHKFLSSFAMFFFLFVLGTARVPSWSLFHTSDQISVWQ